MRYGGDKSEKLVLSYPLEGCHAPVHDGLGSDDDEEGEVLHGQEARSAAVSALKFRVGQLLRQKQLKYIESLDTDLLKAAEVPPVSSDVSGMQTRYLSALQMEVITKLPEGISSSEVLGLTPELPCVQRGFRDSTKFLEEPSLPLASQEQENAARKQQQQQEQQHQEATTGEIKPRRRLQQGWGLSELSARVIQSTKPDAANAFLEPKDSSLRVPPNDPFFLRQWNLQEASPYGINAEKAWKLWTGAQRPMVIAVIDSGCDLDHPDLRDKRWQNPGEICGDGIDNDNNGFVDDCYGWVQQP